MAAQWLFEKIDLNLQAVKIPSPLAHSGTERISDAARWIGLEPAKKLAKHKEYILSEDLVHSLHVSGLSCPEEIRSLSPKYWLELFRADSSLKNFSDYKKEWEAEGAELRGIVLPRPEQAELSRFLKLNQIQPESPWALLEIAEHLFFYRRSHFELLRALILPQ